MKLLSIAIILFITCSCSNKNQEEIDLLRKENIRLKKEITDIKNSRMLDFDYEPLIVSENPTVKLGEDFKAHFYVSLKDKKNPMIITKGQYDYKNRKVISRGDTLKTDKNLNTPELIFKTTKKGNNKWNGIMEFEVEGNKILYPVIVDYKVE